MEKQRNTQRAFAPIVQTITCPISTCSEKMDRKDLETHFNQRHAAVFKVTPTPNPTNEQSQAEDRKKAEERKQRSDQVESFNTLLRLSSTSQPDKNPRASSPESGPSFGLSTTGQHDPLPTSKIHTNCQKQVSRLTKQNDSLTGLVEHHQRTLLQEFETCRSKRLESETTTAAKMQEMTQKLQELTEKEPVLSTSSSINSTLQALRKREEKHVQLISEKNKEIDSLKADNELQSTTITKQIRDIVDVREKLIQADLDGSFQPNIRGTTKKQLEDENIVQRTLIASQTVEITELTTKCKKLEEIVNRQQIPLLGNDERTKLEGRIHEQNLTIVDLTKQVTQLTSQVRKLTTNPSNLAEPSTSQHCEEVIRTPDRKINLVEGYDYKISKSRLDAIRSTSNQPSTMVRQLVRQIYPQTDEWWANSSTLAKPGLNRIDPDMMKCTVEFCIREHENRHKREHSTSPKWKKQTDAEISKQVRAAIGGLRSDAISRLKDTRPRHKVQDCTDESDDSL